MKTLKTIVTLILFALFITNCSQTKEMAIEKETKQIDNELLRNAKRISNEFKRQNYKIEDMMDMENAVYTYLKLKSKSGSISNEAIVKAPNYNIGYQKCLTNIQSIIARIVSDSIRYRVDQAVGGDDLNNSEYVDRFFSASEHLGILKLNRPDFIFLIHKRLNREYEEYRMFAVYSGETVNQTIFNGVKFGNQIKEYIDNGLNK